METNLRAQLQGGLSSQRKEDLRAKNGRHETQTRDRKQKEAGQPRNVSLRNG